MTLRNELTPEIAIELRVRKKLPYSKIAEMYGVSRQRVHQIIKEIEKKHGKLTRRTNIDIITLKKMLDKGLTTRMIADELGEKISKVSRLINKYQDEYENGLTHIKIVRKKSKDLLSKPMLYDLYVNKLYTDEEIATQFQMSASTVNLLRHQYKIPSNNNKRLRKLMLSLSKDVFHRLYVNEGYRLQDIADKFDCNIVAVLNLKKRYAIKK